MNGRSKTTLHFIRHGDAVPDATTPFTGAAGYDAMGLSVKGARQAEALARRLARTTPLIAIYASPTRRAYETAEYVARACGLEVTVDERLREIALGDESLPAELAAAERAYAIRTRLETLAATALREGSWTGVSGVESIGAVRARMAAALATIAGTHCDGHVAVVSHAGSINAYLSELLGIPRDFFFPIGNTSLCSIRVTAGGFQLLRLNDTAHLERDLSREPD